MSGGKSGASLTIVALGCALAAGARCLAQSETGPTPAAALDPAAAALAGFDETTGLWFPPDAPREVYLDRSDPAHNLILDIQKAFAASPALRAAACALAADPKREVRASVLDASVKQRITMFHMLCAGLAGAEQEKQRSADAWRANEARFEKARDPASARSLSFEERRSRFLDLDADLVPADPLLRLDRAFEMLGLMPQAEGAVYRILVASDYFGRATKGEARFHEYLRPLLERESVGGAPESTLYRMALRNYLYLTSRLPEAREDSRRVLGEESLSRWKTDNSAFLALLDRLLGDPLALKRVAARCPVREGEAENYVGRPDGAFCYDLVLRLAWHSVELHGDAAPAALADVFEEVIRAEPANWPQRTWAIHYVVRLNPARARVLAEELLQIPATITPLEARLEVLEDLGTASRKLHDFGRAMGAFDRYLAFLRYRPASVPADVWSRLTALPGQEKSAPSPIERRGWLNISWALGQKAAAATDASDFPGARRAIEAFLANALSLAHAAEKESVKERLAHLVDLEGLPASEREALEKLLEGEGEAVRRAARDEARTTRGILGSYGAALAKAGRQDEAKLVAAYLIAQPGGEGNLPTELYPFFYGARERGEPLAPATSPWKGSPDPRAGLIRSTAP